MRKESWIELKERLLLERGKRCERCRRKAEVIDLHHGLIGRMRSKPELNVEENAQLLCRDCHTNVGGYDERLIFWKRQCKRYGEQHMNEGYLGLNLKIKERF